MLVVGDTDDYGFGEHVHHDVLYDEAIDLRYDQE